MNSSRSSQVKIGDGSVQPLHVAWPGNSERFWVFGRQEVGKVSSPLKPTVGKAMQTAKPCSF